MKLVYMNYKDGNPIVEHLNEINSIDKELAYTKILFIDGLHALLLLSSLSQSWETSVVIISNSTLKGIVTLSQVMNKFVK